jgi:hypothetical protein
MLGLQWRKEAREMTVLGKVKGNTIVLDDGACLPEGARVEVRLLPEPQISRDEAFAAVLRQRELNAGLRIGVDELLEEDRREREEHWDQLFTRDP